LSLLRMSEAALAGEAYQVTLDSSDNVFYSGYASLATTSANSPNSKFCIWSRPVGSTDPTKNKYYLITANSAYSDPDHLKVSFESDLTTIGWNP
jgi:hypothetical protein